MGYSPEPILVEVQILCNHTWSLLRCFLEVVSWTCLYGSFDFSLFGRGFAEHLVKDVTTNEFWPGVRYNREDNFERAWAKYQREKAAGLVHLAARQAGDRELYGPDHLCIM
jgi:hypothetical protein